MATAWGSPADGVEVDRGAEGEGRADSRVGLLDEKVGGPDVTFPAMRFPSPELGSHAGRDAGAEHGRGAARAKKVGLGGGCGEPGGDDGGVEERHAGGVIHGSGAGRSVGGAGGEIEQWSRWGLRIGGEEAFEGDDWAKGWVAAGADDKLMPDPVLIVLGHLDGENNMLAVVVGWDELDVAAGSVCFDVEPRTLGWGGVIGHTEKGEESQQQSGEKKPGFDRF